MNLNLNALLGVVLAGILLGQQAFAQTAQKAAPVKAAPMFVPLPQDIQCSLEGMSFRSTVGKNGELVNTDGSVEGVTCWLVKSVVQVAPDPSQKKAIPLASTTITNGMLSTKDFGAFKLSPTNNLYSTATGIAIRNDRVQPLRNFLAQASVSKQSGSTGSDAYVPIKANCIVYHSGYEGTIVAPGVSEPAGTVAKLECNGKDVEIADSKMVAGIIATKTYGKVKVHFGSMVATVGAGDFTSVAPGKTAPERVRDISVEKSAAQSFTAQFGQ